MRQNAVQDAAVAGDLNVPRSWQRHKSSKDGFDDEQMGIDVTEIENVEEVIIRTPQKDIIFKDAEVSIMDARGMKTYQIIGTPLEVTREIRIPG